MLCPARQQVARTMRGRSPSPFSNGAPLATQSARVLQSSHGAVSLAASSFLQPDNEEPHQKWVTCSERKVTILLPQWHTLPWVLTRSSRDSHEGEEKGVHPAAHAMQPTRCPPFRHTPALPLFKPHPPRRVYISVSRLAAPSVTRGL